MPDKEQGYPLPPQPPEIERKLQFHRLQKVGIPLILLIPILALAGVFGEVAHSDNAASSQLALEVEYPPRSRYTMVDSIRVTVHNASAQPLTAVQVNFARAYIDSFSNVAFTPAVDFITDEFYVLELSDLQPQETRVIAIDIKSKEYGHHKGTVTAVPDNGESVTLSLATFVFP